MNRRASSFPRESVLSVGASLDNAKFEVGIEREREREKVRGGGGGGKGHTIDYKGAATGAAG